MNRTDQRAGLLAECLEEINQSLVELTAVFHVKRQALACSDMVALEQLLAREETVASALFDAECRREVLAEELAQTFGASSDRLADIAAALPDETADVLLHSGARLRDTAGILVREARIVASICQAAVDHYEKLIRIVAGCSASSATYTADGRQGSTQPRSIIDQAL